jgi:hypothetical protein|tara:strand:+ start:303 stop:473 length:171 start_codon:yes stop_codon:yes gene_type:complete
MSLILKMQQELHENNTKWNTIIDKIKKINFKKYENNHTIGLIIDDIVSEELNKEKK